MDDTVKDKLISLYTKCCNDYNTNLPETKITQDSLITYPRLDPQQLFKCDMKILSNLSDEDRQEAIDLLLTLDPDTGQLIGSFDSYLRLCELFRIAKSRIYSAKEGILALTTM